MHLMIFVYTLNMSYTFKFKSIFGNQKCALKNTKSALILKYQFFSKICKFIRFKGVKIPLKMDFAKN